MSARPVETARDTAVNVILPIFCLIEALIGFVSRLPGPKRDHKVINCT
jgi:hypothetical protein